MASSNQRLNATVTIGGALSNSFRGAISSSRKQIATVGDAIKQLKDRQRRLSRVGDHWEKQGRDARQFREELERVNDQMGRLRRNQDKLGRLRNAQKANVAKREQLRGQLFDAVAIGATAAAPITAAVRFESTMADLNKVADLTPRLMKEVRTSILNMTREMPMAADQVGAIMTSAAQSGIAQSQMIDFTRTAIKMGTAFDIAGGQAGDMLAKWRVGMKLTQPQVEELADVTNYLSNNMAATAPEIADVITRVGAMAKTAGIGEKRVAALAASMIAAGAAPERTSTAIRKMASVLTSGDSATKSVTGSLNELGFSASQMAQMMQDDAEGAIRAVFERLNDLDKAKRPAVIQDLFGQESVDVIAPLLSNLDGLDKAFEMAGDKVAYLGSMQREYEQRSKTTENNLQLLKNRVVAVGITLGSVLLPAVNVVAGGLGEVSDIVTDVAERFPFATKVIVGATAALAGLKIASIAGGYAFTFLKGGALSAVGALYRTQAAAAAAGAGATAGPTKLTRALMATSRGAKAALTGVGNLVIGTVKAPFRAALAGPRLLGRAIASVSTGALNAGQSIATMAATAVANPLGALAAGPRLLGRALLGVGRSARVALVGMRALAIATVTNPIGAAITAIAVGALLIIRYWRPIKSFFSGLWSGFESAAGPVGAAMGQIFDALGPVGSALRSVGSGIKSVIGWFGDLLAPVDASKAQLDSFQAKGEAVGQAIGQAFAQMAQGAAKWLKWLVDKTQWVGEAWAKFKGWLGLDDGKSTSKLDLSDAPKAPAIGSARERRPIYQVGQGNDDGPPVPLRRGGGSAQLSDNSTNTNNITIVQQPGEDSQALANRAADEVDRRQRQRRRSALYDQGPSYGY